MSEENSHPYKKHLLLAAKIIFTSGAIYLIVQGADLKKITEYFFSIDLSYLALAVLAQIAGQSVSAFRLKYYFSTVEIFFTKYFSVALYFTGMFFNRLLPSGIGGDGYNTYFLKRYHKIDLKTSVRLLLASRANGLLFVFYIAFFFLFISDTIRIIPYGFPLAIIGVVGVTIGYLLATKFLLKETLDTIINGSKFSIFIQGFVAATAFILLAGIGHTGNFIDYVMIFMFANALVFLPISIGGLGVREFVYFYGATWAGLDVELGVAISVLYFLVETVSSVVGIFFWYRIKEIKAIKETT